MAAEQERTDKTYLTPESSSVGHSSKYIFLQYVKYDTNGEPDVSGIFSKECFIAWLESRVKLPLRPEESFRKALIAHVAGKDKRKPFSEAIERKLLQRLRRHEPWPAFKEYTNGCQKIGERGIKSLGYHEQRNKAAKKSGFVQADFKDMDNIEDTEPSVDTVSKCSTNTENISRKRKLASQVDKILTEEARSFFEESASHAGNTIISAHPKSPKSMSRNLPGNNAEPFSSYTLSQLEVLYTQLKKNFHQRATRSLVNRSAAAEFLRFIYRTQQNFSGPETSSSCEVLCHFLLTTYTDSQLHYLAESSENFSSVYKPSMEQQFQNFPSELGYFYSQEFLCPTANIDSKISDDSDSFDVFSYFCTHKPIGRFVWTGRGLIVDSNEAADKMLDAEGKSLRGKTNSELILSMLHQFLIAKYVVPKKIMGKWYKFFRSILKIRGEVRIFKTSYTNDALDNFDICFQEETELYKDRISTEILFF